MPRTRIPRRLAGAGFLFFGQGFEPGLGSDSPHVRFAQVGEGVHCQRASESHRRRPRRAIASSPCPLRPGRRRSHCQAIRDSDGARNLRASRGAAGLNDASGFRIVAERARLQGERSCFRRFFAHNPAVTRGFPCDPTMRLSSGLLEAGILTRAWKRAQGGRPGADRGRARHGVRARVGSGVAPDGKLRKASDVGALARVLDADPPFSSGVAGGASRHASAGSRKRSLSTGEEWRTCVVS